MNLRWAVALVALASLSATGETQGTSDPTLFPGLKLWAESFSGAAFVGPDGKTVLPGGDISRWISKRGPALSGTGATLDRNLANIVGGALTTESNVALTDQFTMLAAFRPTRVGGRQTLVSIGQSPAIALGLTADRRLEVVVNGQSAVLSHQIWNDRDLSVVAISCNGQKVSLWIDGTLDTTGSLSENFPPHSRAYRVVVGSRADGSDPAQSLVAGLAVYDRELTATERHLAEDRFLNGLAIPRDTTYVSSVKGLSGAGGLLPNDPVASLSEAIDKRLAVGGGTVAVTAPPSLPLREQVDVTTPLPLTLEGVGNHSWTMVSSTRYEGGWRKVGNGVWKRAGAPRAMRSAWVDTMTEADGQPLALWPAATLDGLAPGYYYSDAGVMYLRLPGDVKPNGQTIEVGRQTSCLRIANGNGGLLVANGVFRGGSEGAVEIGQPTMGGSAVFRNCVAEYAFCGFKIGAQLSDATFVKCVGRRNVNDGFNLHAYPGVASSMHLRDCEGYLNKDEGASPHDNTRMYITGGRLHDNGSSGFMAIGNSRLDLSGVEIDHNGQNGFSPTENGFTAWKEVLGRVTDCNIHDNNGPGIYRENPRTITISGTVSKNNAAPDR